MKLVEIEKLYKQEIKKFLKYEDYVLLTKSQRDEINSISANEIEEADIDYLANQYALELINSIDALKEKGLL